MSLFSTLQLAKNCLSATQLGIQVAANNIANTNTPGYVRERLLLAPGPSQNLGDVVLGTGVRIQGVVRQVDAHLQQRLLTAGGDLASGEALEKTYSQLESVIGELGESDLSTALTGFFNGLHDVLNQPETPSVRSLAVLQGESLSAQIRHLDQRGHELRRAVNGEVLSAVDEINTAIVQIAKLNRQIVQAEQGGAIVSDAVGLRDQRDTVLRDLAELVHIQVDEQATGAVNVFVDGSYLVFDGTTQQVEAVERLDRGAMVVDLQLSGSSGALAVSSGKLAGLLSARDEVLAGYLDDLDSFTRTLMFEFNKIHSSSQGLTGFQTVIGSQAVDETAVALDEAGLPFTPAYGSFQLALLNTQSGLQTTHEVTVRLEGLEQDTTLQSLVGQLDAIDGLSASVRYDGRVQLSSDSADLVFSFGQDTSGVLAALGLNTFFTGTGAGDIQVNDELSADPGKLALSSSGPGRDTVHGEQLANLLNTPLDTLDGKTLSQQYEQWMGDVAQASALSAAVAEGYRSFHATLEGEHLSLSGVSLDEEAVNMMAFQRAFQASARVITTIGEMLDVLVNM